MLTTFALLVALHFFTVTATTTAKFGEACGDTNKTCDSCKFLTCQEGTCGCQYPDDQLFDAYQNSCVFKLGKTCQGYRNCMGYSMPVVMVQDYKLAEFCVRNARCTYGKCACKDGFFEASNGTSCEPQRKYGESCSMDKECMTDLGFTCSSNGICACNSTSSYYDNTTQKCATKFGFPCKGYDYSCGTNSQCQYAHVYFGTSSTTYERRCVCDSGHYPNLAGKCEPKREHGVACNYNGECNDKKNLVCGEKGTCACKNDDYVYNSTKSKCEALVGTPCDDNHHRYYYYGSPCVNGARCLNALGGYHHWSSGRRMPEECRCDSDHYTGSNRTCEKRQAHGDPCSEKLPCQSNLQCEAGSCQCSGNGTIYDEYVKECRKPLGSTCSWSRDCISTAWCRNSVCACSNYGSTPDSTGTRCIAGYNSYCNATIQCNLDKGMVCRDGSCECKWKDHQYFDYEAKECLTLTEGPCDNETSAACVKNAECVSTEMLDGQQECRCKKGFVELDRFCQIGYGQPCNTTRSFYGESSCDRLGPLHCIEGTCQCAEFQYYDEVEMKCRGLVGAKCTVSNETVCVPGATCKGFRSRDQRMISGICRCDVGFLTDENRSCVGKDSKIESNSESAIK